MTELSTAIRARMADQRLTQEGLAALMGIRQKKVSQWVRGGCQPRPESYEKLSSILGTLPPLLKVWGGKRVKKIEI